jgi:hypothetical protein
MTPRRRLAAVAAVVGCFPLLLAALFLSIPPAPPALQFSILGRTNDLSGATAVLLSVVNNSRRIQNYAYWAEARTASGWAKATNWDAQHPGRLNWIESHHTNWLALPAPEAAAIWRLKVMRQPQRSALERKWYALVRRTGLRRVGFQEEPKRSFFFTDQITALDEKASHE